MELWSLWTELFSNSVTFLSACFGVTEAVAIILLTLIIRLILFPVSYRAAYQGYKNKKVMEKIKPKMEKLRQQYKDQPDKLIQKSFELNRKHSLKVFTKVNVVNTLLQGLFGLGAYQGINKVALSSKFLWIGNIAKPDLILAIIVGILTFLTMNLMPGHTEQVNVWLFVIPSVFIMFVLVTFPSAIGLYWATSNTVTICQQILLRHVIRREIKS